MFGGSLKLVGVMQAKVLPHFNLDLTMPNPTQRLAKSASNWTPSDLDAHNIQINTVDTQAFFSVPRLPIPTVNPLILNYINAPEPPVGLSLPPEIYYFFAYLCYASDSICDAENQKPSICEFCRCLISEILHLDAGRRWMQTRDNLHFIMNGKQVKASPHISLRDADGRFLLVQIEINPSSQDRAESQLVAKFLATFSTDNVKRTAAGLPAFHSKTYIGVLMMRLAPYFYKTTITQALVDAVKAGQFPAEETIVQRFIPPVPNVQYFPHEGMVPLENRFICFQCFEGLKTLL